MRGMAGAQVRAVGAMTGCSGTYNLSEEKTAEGNVTLKMGT